MTTVDEARARLALEELYETTSLHDVIEEARKQASYCCQFGCGSGACETCDCCCAGSCISGSDGIPKDEEDRSRWLEVAAEHNPVAAALLAATDLADHDRRIKAEAWDECTAAFIKANAGLEVVLQSDADA